MGPDEVIDRLAAQQHGLVTRPQLRAAGLTTRMIDGRLHDKLVVVYRGVYRVRGHAETWEQRLLAASLATGGVVSHRGAAYLHGFPGIEPRPEVTIGHGRSTVVSGVVVHRTRQLGRGDIEVINGIPRTRAARTIIDLVAVVPEELAVSALDDALSRRLVTVNHIRRRLEAAGRRGRGGAAVIRALLDGPARPQSRFERRLFSLLQEAGVPVPIPQYKVELGNGRRAFLDFAWPDLRVGLEADSYRRHSSQRDWERDRVRNRRLTAMGWRILPVTWSELAEPGALLSELGVVDHRLGGFLRPVS
ncbi:MAG: type IV toxin-antitoxin system AbiEi family antitoxin domain-containing protein [Acidimicrobiales bacterium]